MYEREQRVYYVKYIVDNSEQYDRQTKHNNILL